MKTMFTLFMQGNKKELTQRGWPMWNQCPSVTVVLSEERQQSDAKTGGQNKPSNSDSFKAHGFTKTSGFHHGFDNMDYFFSYKAYLKIYMP